MSLFGLDKYNGGIEGKKPVSLLLI